MHPAIRKLEQILASHWTNYAFSVDEPADKDGAWLIDLRAGKTSLVVEYRPQKGFGFFGKDAVFGAGPIEVYRTPELAARRILQLMTGTASQRRRLTLKDVRELYACSQVELAKKLGVKQSAVSRFEQRSEVKLGTLAVAIKALGGNLEVRAHFPDADVPLSIK